MTMNFHGWLLRPDGAHLPAFSMVSMSSLLTLSSVNSLMLLLDRIVSIVSGSSIPPVMSH
ncbi:hypothetical protein V7O62_04250 [Methanolobus sp. ZRKC2]|uniref:hypothetical protein n=1 Tax=Methanolobus sp. ZRKC2 TaxID=3125783 RepID=UPI0032436189